MEENVLLKELTTLKAGGNARFLFHIRKKFELTKIYQEITDRRIPYIVLGGGSNILFSDKGFSGAIIKIEIKGCDILLNEDEIFLRAGAGEIWDDVVRFSVEQGLWGLENLSAIPGTVGGAPIQNIGAYGVEVKDSIESVEVFDMQTGGFVILKNDYCKFSYRHSIFKDDPSRYIVVGVIFKLRKQSVPKISYKDLANFFVDFAPQNPLEVRNAVILIRSKKFPDLKKFGTAGSFFKNPIVESAIALKLKEKFPELPIFDAGEGYKKISAAWIFDHVLHLKGFRDGGIFLYENQPIVLTTDGDVTAEDIKSFSKKIKESFFSVTGINIDEEVVFI